MVFLLQILVIGQRVNSDEQTVMSPRRPSLTTSHFNEIDQKRLYPDRHCGTLECSLVIAVLGSVWLGKNPDAVFKMKQVLVEHEIDMPVVVRQRSCW